jgi:hypothetical protein
MVCQMMWTYKKTEIRYTLFNQLYTLYTLSDWGMTTTLANKNTLMGYL